MTANHITAPDGSLWQLVPVEATEEMWEAGKYSCGNHVTRTIQTYSRMLAAAPEFGGVAVAARWLEDLRWRMEHCVSAADEGEDYAVPRDVLGAMTTLGLMEKVRRGRWAPTDAGRDFAATKPTLPVEIHGKMYEVPIPVQLHIIHLREKVSTHPPADDEAMGRDAERWRHARHHALFHLLQAYPTPDTSDVGLDYAVDAAIAAMRGGESGE